MGCDINFYIEIKQDGKWVQSDFPEKLIPWDRNYYVFGIFGEGQYQDDHFLPDHISFLNRGIPKDSSYPKEKNKDRYGLTYAYLDELMQINWGYCEVNNEEEMDYEYPLDSSYFKAWVKYILPTWFDSFNGLSYRNIRIIVWFDN